MKKIENEYPYKGNDFKDGVEVCGHCGKNVRNGHCGYFYKCRCGNLVTETGETVRFTNNKMEDLK